MKNMLIALWLVGAVSFAKAQGPLTDYKIAYNVLENRETDDYEVYTMHPTYLYTFDAGGKDVKKVTDLWLEDSWMASRWGHPRRHLSLGLRYQETHSIDQ